MKRKAIAGALAILTGMALCAKPVQMQAQAAEPAAPAV